MAKVSNDTTKEKKAKKPRKAKVDSKPIVEEEIIALDSNDAVTAETEAMESAMKVVNELKDIGIDERIIADLQNIRKEEVRTEMVIELPMTIVDDDIFCYLGNEYKTLSHPSAQFVSDKLATKKEGNKKQTKKNNQRYTFGYTWNGQVMD